MNVLGDFTWTSAGVWGAFLALLGIIARQVGPWRKQSMDAEQTFRDGLLKRVEVLEAKIESERARHEAQMAIYRHRLNNVSQAFDAMMMMLKANPDRVAETIQLVEQMRADHLRAEALEKAALNASLIAGIDP